MSIRFKDAFMEAWKTLTPEGSIGSGTKSENEYAYSTGKPVHYLEEI